MSIVSWLRKRYPSTVSWLSVPSARSSRRRAIRSYRPRFETLEGRALLATVMVTNTTDVTDGMPVGTTKNIAELIADPGADGTISLREAIMASNNTSGSDNITFDPVTSSMPIRLSQGRLWISQALTITGLGASNTTVSGEGRSLIFDIGPVGTINDVGPVTFAGLTLTGGKGSDAGAIRSQLVAGAVLTVSKCTIENNGTTGTANRTSAGGINSFSAVTVINSTISRNSSAGGSGGIFAQGLLTVIDSTISDNGSGGGINGSRVTVLSSTISGNSAHGRGTGGGIDAHVDLMISDSTIFGNSADYGGGGIHAWHGVNLAISGSTISGNFAGYGGGIFAEGTVTVSYSIVAGNLDEEGSPDLGVYAVPTVTNSLIGDNYDTGLDATLDGALDANGNLIGAADAPIDPVLGPLADNGGPTKTMALLSGSPAIDNGNPNSAALPPYVQRGAGFARISNGRADMGAYEVQRSLFTPTVSLSDGGGTFNGSPFPVVATVAGQDGVASESLDGIIPILTYYSGPTADGPALSDAPFHAGIYTVVADFAGSAQYSPARASATFTIDRATPILRILPSLTIVLGSSASLGGQINSGALIPSGGVAITLEGTIYFAAIQRDGTFSAYLPAGSVAAGSYVVDYAYGGDADFISARALQSLVVLSAQQETTLVMEQVTALVSAGILDSGSGKALTAALNNAIASLNKDNTSAGVNQLSVFAKQVNAFVKSGKVTGTDGRALISEIDEAIAAALASVI